MTRTEETHQCEIELELSKRDFRDDLSRIGQKLHDARVDFSPMHIIGARSLFISGVGLVVGFVLGNRDMILRFNNY